MEQTVAEDSLREGQVYDVIGMAGDVKVGIVKRIKNDGDFFLLNDQNLVTC
jgi:hypothetical protein